jgi:tRNA-Thr(GGU) m(6)t(6)A37 methyltransferase TsaA
MTDYFPARRIGVVRSPVMTPVDNNWGDVESAIDLDPEFEPGLEGLEAFSHAIVLTWLHKADFSQERHLIRRPRGMAEFPRIGIFAQRAKDRPNPIGVSVVEIRGRREGSLIVRRLDAIDGTPVMDIKPYFPIYDRVETARTPEWVDRLMTGYF